MVAGRRNGDEFSLLVSCNGGLGINLKDEGFVRLSRPVNFSVYYRPEAIKEWPGIETRCAVCAVAKVQNFFLRETAATSRRVRLKSGGRNPPGNMVTTCAAERRWWVTGSNCAKSRRSNESILSSKDSSGIISTRRTGRKAL